MKWFKQMVVNWVREDWENANQPVEESYKKHRNGLIMGTAMVEKGSPEGENTIRFELSSAVGGKILNVRHYDERKDRHEHQTYVIPNGEDVGERVAKIINLEMFKQ